MTNTTNPNANGEALVDEATQELIELGSTRRTFQGDEVVVLAFYSRPAPSTGRVTVRFKDGAEGDYYPAIIRASIVDM